MVAVELLPHYGRLLLFLFVGKVILFIFLVFNCYRLGYSSRNCLRLPPHLARNPSWKDEEEVQDYLSYNVFK